jgi:hypothetical protein
MDLHRAIVEPARNVFEDWGLECDADNRDAPFAPGMASWLMAGARRSSSAVQHRPDELPLLQHALQATWHAAMQRWSRDGDRPTIEREDLPGQLGSTTEVPDLGSCLRVRADHAAGRAAQRFAEAGKTSVDAGEAALQATFRALARRDDRGVWTRRFADQTDIRSFMGADPILLNGKMTEGERWEALCQALDVFLSRGYLSGGGQIPYDISHEALIRNWPKFQEWLRVPEEVTYALIRVLAEVDPVTFANENDLGKMQAISSDTASKVAALRSNGELPAHWAADQIAPTLKNPTMRQRWGEKERALQKVVKMAACADKARERQERERRRSELARLRLLRVQIETSRLSYASSQLDALDTIIKASEWWSANADLFVCCLLQGPPTNQPPKNFK